MCVFCFFLMFRRPPRSTRTTHSFPTRRSSDLSTRSAEVAGLRRRPLAPSDEDLYCRLYTDPGVMRHVGPPLARGAASCAFGSLLRQQAIDPPRSRHWVLVSRDDGGALGLMDWLPDTGDPGSAEARVLRSGECRLGEGGVSTCK